MITERLEQFINNEKTAGFKNYGLENMTRLMRLLGNPHENIKTIHIAGTNGKGSVAHMLSSILVESGLKTGLFTSPHLERLNERIMINNQEINDNEMNACLNRVLDIIDSEEDLTPTYFDIITAAAFIYFSSEKADLAVIETGLGGRLDSTNIILPELALITSISRDHTLILGESLQDIAFEKAGIIKQGVPVIVYEQDEEVSKILTSAAIEKHAHLIAPGNGYELRDIQESGSSIKYILSFDLDGAIHETGVTVNSPVREQAGNSALAVMAAFILKKNFSSITEKSILAGIEKAVIPGRFCILNENPGVIFDPAHNISGITSLLNTIKKMYDNRAVFVISFMADKDIDELFAVLENSGFPYHYFQLSDERAFDAYSMKKKPAGLKSILCADDLPEKLNTEDNVIVFTGTFRIFSAAGKFSQDIKK